MLSPDLPAEVKWKSCLSTGKGVLKTSELLILTWGQAVLEPKISNLNKAPFVDLQFLVRLMSRERIHNNFDFFLAPVARVLLLPLSPPIQPACSHYYKGRRQGYY